MDDEVGVAADRRGEVAVGAGGQSRVAEVLRVVARLLERAEDERRERLAAAPALLHVRRHALADLAGEPSGDARTELVGVGRRRRGHLQVGELRKE